MAAMSLLSLAMSEYASVSLPEEQESVNLFLILFTTEFTKTNLERDVSTVFRPLRGMSVNFLTDTSYRWLASSNLSILSSASMSLGPARSPFLKVLHRVTKYIWGMSPCGFAALRHLPNMVSTPLKQEIAQLHII